MEILDQYILKIPDFGEANLTEKAIYFGYFLNRILEKPFFESTDIVDLFEKSHLKPPSNVRDILSKQSKKPPARIINTKNGYKLERKEIERILKLTSEKPISGKTKSAIKSHLKKNLDLISQGFVDEAVHCYEHHLFRSALLMTWQFAIYILYVYVFNKKLVEFNTQYKSDAGNKKGSVVNSIDDFSEIREAKFLEYCKAARIFNVNEIKILKHSLDTRNIFAHPSSIKLSEEKCSVYIIDLFDNIINRYA